jgi:hypothetical protein
MNIIFEGDWVKVLGRWSQVVEVFPGDVVALSRKNDFGEPLLVSANTLLIERVLSDSEMQEMLQAFSERRIEQRRKADRAILQSSSSESASLAGGSPRFQQRGAPYGSRV